MGAVRLNGWEGEGATFAVEGQKRDGTCVAGVRGRETKRKVVEESCSKKKGKR